ncbi:MAG: hypothetical protein WAQ52_08080 [Terriglobales bacterium]
MRSLAIWMVLFALAAGPAAAKDESVDELKSRVQNALPQDRPHLCVQIAQLQLRSADKLYTDGNAEQARTAVEEVVTYSEKARDSAKETKKHLKNVEIAVRKMAEKLKDIKRTLAFEDQPPVDHAIERLEDVRTTLLKEMFKKEKK